MQKIPKYMQTFFTTFPSYFRALKMKAKVNDTVFISD